MAATIRDITKMTGLSLATVSKYLNGGNVLPQNRTLIEEAIETLQYEVNEVARGLAKNRTKTIGVLIPNLDNIFAGTIIAHIEDILRQHDYGTIVCDCRSDIALEEQEIKFLLSKRVDGIITIPTSGNPAYLSSAISRNIPIVLIDRTFENTNLDSVLVDNSEASFRAVSTLIDHGHKSIGIICGNDNEYTARERLMGYYKALEMNNRKIELDFVKRGTLTVEHGYEATKSLLTSGNKPTALYLSNYEITLGAIIAINELGINFPEDISIIGFDNLMLSKVVKPKLWMVVQPMEEIASSAAHIMLDRLSKQKETITPDTINPAKHEAVRLNLSTSLLTGESIKKV
ncbi:LacI family DNA-binding transcriptional regulator [Konateibacter massiliensis]|uniref:LacI family DNA-binding transcriptional regulator n=1 Tax=Konateibacter massiliensis TaxID=2002841 RepID=UPI001F437583|nr:LacI family DNA-binding transcriptional regulator [Konateibacter massiliensis]